MEERETHYRVDTLLARLMDNIPVLARLADIPAPSQSHEAGPQAPAEAAHAPAPHLAGHHGGSERLSALVVAGDVQIGLVHLQIRWWAMRYGDAHETSCLRTRTNFQ